MKRIVLGTLVLVSTLAGAAVPIQENFRCGVKGWNYEELDFQRFGEFYRVQKTRLDQIPPRVYEFVIPVSDCHSDSKSIHPGVFSCKTSRAGKAVINNESRRYESTEVDVRYEEKENDYEPLKEKYPTWYFRVAAITFSGGDFPGAGERHEFTTKVNYHKSGDFRETCRLDGKLISQ